MINYEETREILEEVLDELLEESNSDFIEKLPDTPQEILKFAKRRVYPYISDSIKPSLAKQMLEMRLSDKEYLRTLFKAMYVTFVSEVDTSNNPTAAILVSQTGAGKTNLRRMINPENSKYIVINPDLYKKYRFDADKIREMDQTHFGALTGIDSYDHADNIRSYAMEKGYNILIEVAPSMVQGLIGVNEKELEDHGYELHLHVMAVGDLVSAISIHTRYETSMFVFAGKEDTKLTDLNRHDDSYMAVERCIKGLPPEMISLYVRGESVGAKPIKVDTEGKTTSEIIDTLREERSKSNYNYVTGKGASSFTADYENIMNLMRMRKAPEEEYNQINTIYQRYIEYINLIRQDEER